MWCCRRSCLWCASCIHVRQRARRQHGNEDHIRRSAVHAAGVLLLGRCVGGGRVRHTRRRIDKVRRSDVRDIHARAEARDSPTSFTFEVGARPLATIAAVAQAAGFWGDQTRSSEISSTVDAPTQSVRVSAVLASVLVVGPLLDNTHHQDHVSRRIPRPCDDFHLQISHRRRVAVVRASALRRLDRGELCSVAIAARRCRRTQRLSAIDVDSLDRHAFIRRRQARRHRTDGSAHRCGDRLCVSPSIFDGIVLGVKHQVGGRAVFVGIFI